MNAALGVGVATLLLVGVPSRAAGQPSSDGQTADPVQPCQALVATEFDDGSVVTSAVEVPVDGATPAHCSVTVRVPERINVMVLLPTADWNLRYRAEGNGGYAGAIVPPTAGLGDGYATSATDTGHTGAIVNGEWAWSPTGMNEAQIEDFAYRANHEMAVKAKVLIEAYYGQPPVHSYWNGCSTGGREGLTAAMRYPADFDAIAAAAPAINWTRFIPAEMWPQVVYLEHDNFLPTCKQEAAVEALRAICDPQDGLEDGIVDGLHCDVDFESLIGLETPCGELTEDDVAVLEKIHEGARRTDGSFLWYGLEPGTDLSGLAGTASTPDGTTIDGLPFPIAEDWFQWWLHKDPTWDWHTLTHRDFEAGFDQSVEEWRAYLATNSTDLQTFRDRGGKLVMWHGLADQLIFPQGTVDYYERLVDDMGPAEVDEFVRFFLAPDVAHCSGGAGAQPTNVFESVVDWYETADAPDSWIGTLPDGGTRLLCPYPQVPRHDGTGATDNADSFACAPSYTAADTPSGHERPDPAPRPTPTPRRTGGTPNDRASLPATGGGLATAALLSLTAAATMTARNGRHRP